MDHGANRIFDELAKLMTDGAGVAQGLRREAETAFRAQAERFLADIDLVKREDFDVVREMASRARADNEALTARLEALEMRVSALEQPAKRSRRASSTGKSEKK